LLHPAIDTEVDESVQIQGHQLRFATVDLSASHTELRARLLQLMPVV
jgi:5-methylcytosine-specific restriction enzyme subunit McrC